VKSEWNPILVNKPGMVGYAYNTNYVGVVGRSMTVWFQPWIKTWNPIWKIIKSKKKTVELVTIAKLWKQSRCPTTNEWIKKMWCLYTMEFYSAMKKNEILSLTSKWMELENIILSKVSEAQKARNHMFSLICGLWI
jgi:hypothetical protein